MRTKTLMSFSALFLAILGVGASFLPQEILVKFGMPANGASILLVQAIGALYLGFAILNWMARAVAIGGIYSRPVALGNLIHFAVTAITGWKAIAAASVRGTGILLVCSLFSIFAVWFGFVVFTSPTQRA